MINKYKKITIKSKIFYLFSFFAAIILLIMSISFRKIYKTLSDDFIARTNENLFLKGEETNTFFKNNEKDILFLKNLSSMNNLLNIKKTSDEYEQERTNLKSDFISFVKENEMYDQLRYIDETGQEVVRIDQTKNGLYSIIGNDELQNKSDRYYFIDSMKNESDNVYISPLDLNIEHGEIEDSYRPVVRYAVRVFDKEREEKGIIISNIDARYISNFGNFSTNDIFLINKDGYYLFNPNSDKEWGFMFGNDEMIQNDFPVLSAKVFSKDESIFYSNKIKGHVLSRKIYQDWRIISFLEDTTIQSSLSGFVYVPLIVFSAIIISIFISYMFLVKSVIDPIKYLKEGAVLVSKGNLSHIINVVSDDEIGQLSQEFNKMTKSLKKNKLNIEEKIAQRTITLEKLNKLLVGRELKMIEMKKELSSIKKSTNKVQNKKHS